MFSEIMQSIVLTEVMCCKYSGNRIYRSALGEHSNFDISGFQPNFDIQKTPKNIDLYREKHYVVIERGMVSRNIISSWFIDVS